MSTELLVAIIGLVAVAIPATVEAWRSRRRREEGRAKMAPASPAAQPLREEAVTALLDAVMSADSMEPTSQDEAREGMEAFETEYRALVRLRARLGITRGIGEQEVEAFTEAARMVSRLFEAVSTYYGRRSDFINPSAAAAYLADEMETIDLARAKFQIAFERFTAVAKEATVETPY